MDKNLTKKQQKELEKLSDEVICEAKKVKRDYEKNPSKMSGSYINIHEKSPFLDTELNSDKPLYSGSRWTKVLKSF